MQNPLCAAARAGLRRARPRRVVNLGSTKTTAYLLAPLPSDRAANEHPQDLSLRVKAARKAAVAMKRQ